jgi:Ni2+-binding GTPase involved in maturation of urease and hydrogenase
MVAVVVILGICYRLTLLLGPPSSGKTTLLLALAGKLDKDLRVRAIGGTLIDR